MYKTSAQLIEFEGDRLCVLRGQKLTEGMVMYFAGYQAVVLKFSYDQIALIFREENLDLYWEMPEGCSDKPYDYTVKSEVSKYAGYINSVIGCSLTGITISDFRFTSNNDEEIWQLGGLNLLFDERELRILNLGDETGIENSALSNSFARLSYVCA